MYKRTNGYSLMELMVVVAIIGIVAAIAYPRYQGYIEEGYRSTAVFDLKVCALALERHYSDGFTYIGADDAAACNLRSPTEGTQRYALSYESLTSAGFTIRATPLDRDCDDDDVVCVELDETGDQTTI